MITETVRVKTYKEKLFCNKCMAEAKYTGETALSNPPKFLHKCTRCGHTASCFEQYPKIYYVEVQEDEKNEEHIGTADIRAALKATREDIERVASKAEICNKNREHPSRHPEVWKMGAKHALQVLMRYLNE